jgi:regulator of RNase E activity RraA
MNPETRERLRRISTATLTTQLFKLGYRNVSLGGLRPLCPEARMVGIAATMRFAPARGDVATFGAPAAGDILVACLKARGAAGLVADGGIRDYRSVQQLGFPPYALGPSAPAHAVRHVAVDSGVPIGCAEVLVTPGDIMVGDAEGVVCIPRAAVETVAAGGEEQEQLEAFLLGKIKGGAPLAGTYPPDEATLAEFEARRRPPR